MLCVSDIYVCRGGYVVLINPPLTRIYQQSADQFTVQLTVTGLLIDSKAFS